MKPNPGKEARPGDPEGWQQVLTLGSVVRAVRLDVESDRRSDLIQKQRSRRRINL